MAGTRDPDRRGVAAEAVWPGSLSSCLGAAAAWQVRALCLGNFRSLVLEQAEVAGW